MSKLKLYTKRGDNGYTSLYDKRNISKDNLNIHVVGAIDELSAHIGLLCVYVSTNKTITKCLREIQSDLLNIGSCIATLLKEPKTPLVKERVAVLERDIDSYENSNPKLTEFILPGIQLADAQTHVCRTVCRRLERHLISLNLSTKIDNNILAYINRLSDYFFALSRHLSNGKEIKRSEI